MILFNTTFTSILSSGHPYLNPGTGALIIQAILGALFAIGLTVRIFWSRIKKLLKHTDGTEPAVKEQDETR